MGPIVPPRVLALTLSECQTSSIVVLALVMGGCQPSPDGLAPRDSRKKRSTVSVAIKPLEDRIVIKQVEAEQTTASGLVIPDTAKEKPQEGEVVAVGPGRIDDNGNRVPLDIAVGDRVIYSKYGGTEVKYGGDDLLVLSARDVLAVVVH
jgi:chaperonin GroES